MDDPSDRPPTEHATERLQQAAHQGLRDDIARSPLDTLARRRLMNELDAWRQRPGDALSRPTGLSSLAGIRERFEHAVESLSSTPDEDPATNAEPPPRVLALRPALKRRESELDVGDGLEWVTKGSGAGAEGILSRHLPDGASGELVETCSGI